MSVASLVPAFAQRRERTHHPVADLLRRRYGSAVPLEAEALGPDQWNDLLTGLLSHKSVRAYRPDPLPQGTLETLVAAAQSAPTSSNLQAWSVVAVTDPERKSRFAAWAANQAHIEQAPLFLVWLADLSRLDTLAKTKVGEAAGLDYLETLIVAITDATLAAQNAVVAAESLGLGTVYIGAIRNETEAVARELNLPPKVLPLFGLCVGYADPARPTGVKPRLPQSVVLHHERYDATGADAAISAYDGQVRAFYAAQGIATPDWSETVTNRVRGPAALSGRHRLRQTLLDFGFPLR
ncbi:NADPH-dependent oxidoreductase [Nitrospirillum sp. BR 11163]|uniref:NADPH-dependent oxidoreductase n=1 Tax=Nitrospirillum sp. BR 11163 TaxID=3104323 RepID=UPI002AFDE052|nr:NADPH-dependent oxidoreductase [Nitrospirillum sp. BR 11163]MEA1675236.1 NADPH-dependent oxidoreductase [Nitrospirillum sp. BR 11163]